VAAEEPDGMPSPQPAALAAQALDLPASERANLALLLFESVEHEPADVWPTALVIELRRRSEELRSGKVKGLTSEEVFGESL
jgi:putative addiction module component (TIGR02574 family)